MINVSNNFKTFLQNLGQIVVFGVSYYFVLLLKVKIIYRLVVVVFSKDINISAHTAYYYERYREEKMLTRQMKK